MEMISGRLVEEVNPTCVGMDRERRNSQCLRMSKPHVRGDGPILPVSSDPRAA